MDAIRSRNRYSFIVIILLYIQAFVFCSIEHFQILVGFGNDLGFVCVGLMTFTMYLLVYLLPTSIISKVTTVRLLIIIAPSMLITFFLNSTKTALYIIECVGLSVTFILAILRCRRIAYNLKFVKATDYTLLEFKIYKLHELNIMNFVLFFVIFGALVLVGLSIATLVYSVICACILIFVNYERMFKAHLNYGSIWAYILESMGIIFSFFITLILDYAEISRMYNWFVILLMIPYIYNTIMLWREYHNYLGS